MSMLKNASILFVCANRHANELQNIKMEELRVLLIKVSLPPKYSKLFSRVRILLLVLVIVSSKYVILVLPIMSEFPKYLVGKFLTLNSV